MSVLSRPPIEEAIGDPRKALEPTKIANDEMAELVRKYPDKFPYSRPPLKRPLTYRDLISTGTIS